jgi:hypothetical protein
VKTLVSEAKPGPPAVVVTARNATNGGMPLLRRRGRFYGEYLAAQAGKQILRMNRLGEDFKLVALDTGAIEQVSRSRLSRE